LLLPPPLLLPLLPLLLLSLLADILVLTVLWFGTYARQQLREVHLALRDLVVASLSLSCLFMSCLCLPVTSRVCATHLNAQGAGDNLPFDKWFGTRVATL
jgi:antibiotic biosynthesis monooxygenase (ABM) superfamily enzyme